jgi:hypothetical protein
VRLSEEGFEHRYLNLPANRDLIIRKTYIGKQEYRLIGSEGYSGGHHFIQTKERGILRIPKEYFTQNGNYTLFAGDDIYNTVASKTLQIRVSNQEN